MPLAEDQHVIQALTAKRPREPFRVSVRPPRPDRCLGYPRAEFAVIDHPGEEALCGKPHRVTRARKCQLNWYEDREQSRNPE